MDFPPDDRWSFTTHLINRWWPPLRTEDGVAPEMILRAEEQLGITLPLALQEWYRLAGQRQDFIGNQDHLVPLNNLTIANDVLVFCIENQGVVNWGVQLDQIHLRDPPVLVDWYDEAAETYRWKFANPAVSSFMLDMLIEAILISGKFTGRGEATPNLVTKLEQHYQELPLRYDQTKRFFGDVTPSFRSSIGKRMVSHSW